jgi:ammonium transporter, Amt family
VGGIGSTVVWMSIRFLSRAPGFRHVDDTLGVIYTHGIAGLCGGLMVGLFADPALVEYIGVGGASNLPGKASVFNGGSWTLLRWQAETGLWVILFSGAMTFILLKVVSIFLPLRLTDEELEIGDHAIHGNEVYPSDVPTLGGPHAPSWQPGSGGTVPAGAGA